MGEITFEGEAPFELEALKEPTTAAEGGTVVVTLPVSAPELPSGVAEVQVLLTIPQATHLAAQIQPVLVTARMNVGLKRR